MGAKGKIEESASYPYRREGLAILKLRRFDGGIPERDRSLRKLSDFGLAVLAYAGSEAWLYVLVRATPARLAAALATVGPRFKAETCSVADAASASCRIHLLATRRGESLWPDGSPESSYRAYIGLRPRPRFLDTATVLSRFGPTLALQRARYRAFVERALFEPSPDTLTPLQRRCPSSC